MVFPSPLSWHRAKGGGGIATWWVTVVAGVAIIGWVVPALLMLDRGFTVRDEGTYLVSYRFWDTNPYFVAGSQYFYGPIFHLFGESIQALRLLRLGMNVACHLALAWALITWAESALRRQFTAARRVTTTMLLVAAGGMTYIWAPLTPGYYDLAGDGTILLVALLLILLRRPERIHVAMLMGGVSLLVVVTKWSAFGSPIIIVLAALWALRPADTHARGRFLVAYVGGVAAAGLVCHTLLVPLDDLIPTMWEVNRLSATGSHSAGAAARGYVKDIVLMAIAGTLVSVPSIAGAVAGWYARHTDLPHRRQVRVDRTLVVLGILVSGVLVPWCAGWRGGDVRGKVMEAVALAALATAFIVVVRHRAARPSSPDRLRPHRGIVLVLLLTPLAQAGGSTVPLQYLVGQCIALWFAAVLVLGWWKELPERQAFQVNANLGMSLLAIAALAATTTLQTPFGTTGYHLDTASVPQLDVKVSADEAAGYAALTEALRPFVQPGKTFMVTLDRKAGLTYVLGGVQLGSAWTDNETIERTAQLISLDCEQRGRPGTPVLMVDRPPDPALVAALRTCDTDFPGDYRELLVPGGPPGLLIYVPRVT